MLDLPAPSSSCFGIKYYFFNFENAYNSQENRDNSEIRKIPCQKHVPDLISTKKHELFLVFIRVNRARFVIQKKTRLSLVPRYIARRSKVLYIKLQQDSQACSHATGSFENYILGIQYWIFTFEILA
eukprot:SAG11_NODE_721_length_7539_cov_32.292473_3_plen_127_part_00